MLVDYPDKRLSRGRQKKKKKKGEAGRMTVSYLDGGVPGQSALELLKPAGDLVAQGGMALLVVDLLAEQAAALGGGAGGVLASHFVVISFVAGGIVGGCFCGGCWAER
jgi:hypothetical protein